ncbi:MAG: hypothetical protein OEZ48_01735 [Candidatus Bathyarchaeota archaeon]|nr:hypothetical protein [Candidatus Bathyarchaeota archaeon]MDH5686579.1 hypothetical protein [Candidatus Bathyarchaeota archaeon]
MLKGKPWTVEEEKQLRKLSEVVVLYPLGTTTSLQLPNDLPSVEEASEILAAALKASAEPGLDKVKSKGFRSWPP